MTTGSWIFMLTTWAVITGLVVFCYWKIMTVRGRTTPSRPGEKPAADPARPGAPGGDR